MLVGLRDLDERHVDDGAAGPEEGRHLGQEDGRVVGAALGHRGARVGADEEGVVPEALVEAWLGIGRDAEGHDVDDLRVIEVLAGGQGTDQRLRLAGTAAHEDARAVPDAADRVGRRLDLVVIAALPIDVAGLAHAAPTVRAVGPGHSVAFGPGTARPRPLGRGRFVMSSGPSVVTVVPTRRCASIGLARTSRSETTG